jgi:hypothetical protein
MTSSPASGDRLAPAGRRRRLLMGGVFASVFAVAAAIPPSSVVLLPVICPLKLATGLDCPLCGMTRAFVFAVHGNLAAASAFNPAWPVAASLLVAVVALCWRDASTGSNLAGRMWRGILAQGWMMVTALALLTLVRWTWPAR